MFILPRDNRARGRYRHACMVRILPACVWVLFVAACGAGAASSADAGTTRGPRERCPILRDRADCERDEACTWAEADDGTTWCLPEPPDCRVQGCPDALACVQLDLACVPGCTDPAVCCVPWHTCRAVDAGVFDE